MPAPRLVPPTAAHQAWGWAAAATLLVGVWRERVLSRLNRGEEWPALVNYKVEFQKLWGLRKERKLPEAIPTYDHHHLYKQ